MCITQQSLYFRKFVQTLSGLGWIHKYAKRWALLFHVWDFFLQIMYLGFLYGKGE